MFLFSSSTKGTNAVPCSSSSYLHLPPRMLAAEAASAGAAGAAAQSRVSARTLHDREEAVVAARHEHEHAVGISQRNQRTTLAWAWDGYEQARLHLRDARNRQLELKQALEDLALATRETTRLNELLLAARRALEEARRASGETVILDRAALLRDTPARRLTVFTDPDGRALGLEHLVPAGPFRGRT